MESGKGSLLAPLRTRVGPQSVGLTTNVPMEAVYAAGRAPADLNNLFITGAGLDQDLLQAEQAGFPRSCCGWTKGVFQAALKLGIRTLAAVVQGDCSNAQAVADLLAARGVEVIPFSYPFQAQPDLLEFEIRAFCRRLGTDLEAAEQVRMKLEPIRNLAREVDRLTWEEGRVSGDENALALVSASDMLGDPETYRSWLLAFLELARRRVARPGGIRVGYVGVPSLFLDLFPQIEALGARVVHNETARQFALLDGGAGLVDQYARFTYPYSFDHRIADIRRAVKEREIHCLVHHTQSFCFHQAEDQLLRESLNLPILTIESDRPGGVDPRTLVRLESFFDLVGGRRRALKPKRITPAALGIDLGSRSVKAVLVKDGRPALRKSFDTIRFCRRFARGKDGVLELDTAALLNLIAPEAGLPGPEPLPVVATGYGRHNLKLAGARVISELEAHVRGVVALTGLKDFTLVDIGGQDTKVIRVRAGAMAGFSMNDKCAAGSGRYLENMARALRLSLNELGSRHADPITLDTTCAVFGESEVLGHLVRGTPEPRILAGINHSLVMRVMPAIRRLPSPVLVLSGGVARNPAVRHLIGAEFPGRVVVPAYPQFCGALGCVAEFLSERK